MANINLNSIKPYHAIMAAIFGLALVAGWGMLPGDNERIAMLERDGHSRDALAILEGAYQGGDKRYRTLHQMVGLYENEGNVARARDLLEEMTVQRPRDAALRKRLAQFYRDTQNSERRVAALRSEVEIRYSEGTCREIIASHRLQGDYDAEKAAIVTCRQKGYRRPDDLARLAELLAVEGDSAQAAAILRSIDDVKRLKEPGERLQLLAFLLEQEQPKEAERRALRWIKATKDDAFAVGIIDTFARSRYPSSALSLAKESGEAGDSIALTIAERLLEQSQSSAAQLYLRGWLDHASLKEEGTAVRFIFAAIEAQDPKTALAGARKFGLKALPPEPLLRLVQALNSAGYKAEARQVRDVATAISEPETDTSTTAGSEKKTDPSSEAGMPGTSTPGTSVPGTSVPGTSTPGTSMPGTGTPGTGRSRQIRFELPRAGSPDPLEPWRKSLLAKVSDDADRHAAALGLKVVRLRVPTVRDGRHDARPHANTKVLRKTARVLQRTKSLRSLRQKQKLARDAAREKAKATRSAAPATTTAPAPQPAAVRP